MRFGSVCSGIEAASVAFNPIGWSAAWFAEIEPFPSAVLSHHYPSVQNLGDMTTISRRVLQGEVEAPNLLCGGTPCQAFSVAGLRESLGDERGNLTLKFVELADAIDFVRGKRGEEPAVILWENVPGVLSTHDNAFGCFLAGLAGEDAALEPPGGKWSNAGAVYGPTRAVAWRTLDAQYFGLAQRRRRVFVVASARDGFDPATVLFEWDGVRRDSAPSRKTREGVAGTLDARAKGGGFLGSDGACCGHVVPTLDASFGRLQGCSGQDANHGHGHLVAHSLRGEGFDASEDGTGRGTPLVPVPFDTTKITSADNRSNPKAGDPCHPLAAGAHPPAIAFSSKDHGADATTDLAPTLRAMNHADSHANGGGQMAVAIFRGENDGRMDGGTPQSQNDLPAGSVRGLRRCECGSAPQERGLEGPQTGEPAAPVPELPHEGASVGNAVHAVREEAQGPGVLRDALPAAEAARRPGIQTDATCLQCGGLRGAEPFNGILREARAAIQAGDTGQAADDEERGRTHPMAVRRLTPVECERLMGFPDNYTLIPWRKKPASECPDGPRYKALGNSWAVPCVRWIGRRINSAIGMKVIENKEAA